ncbi:uncharacterized protein LOC143470200 isoform X1 [Clavelina lepadiformis]|uniref:uncharacterized protein LOC143470200 isoform X1 n=1 Tax=Clavelina lepadiformis TaxID=159417 RepID=UPI0040418B34
MNENFNLRSLHFATKVYPALSRRGYLKLEMIFGKCMRSLHFYFLLVMSCAVCQEFAAAMKWKVSDNLGVNWRLPKRGRFKSGYFMKDVDTEVQIESDASLKQISCQVQCEINKEKRIGCGYTGLSEKKCLAKQCCWDENANTSSIRCYRENTAVCKECLNILPHERVYCQTLLKQSRLMSMKRGCTEAGCCWQKSRNKVQCYDKKKKRSTKLKCEDIIEEKRERCGGGDISEEECWKRGCCYDNRTLSAVKCFGEITSLATNQTLLLTTIRLSAENVTISTSLTEKISTTPLPNATHITSQAVTHDSSDFNTSSLLFLSADETTSPYFNEEDNVSTPNNRVTFSKALEYTATETLWSTRHNDFTSSHTTNSIGLTSDVMLSAADSQTTSAFVTNTEWTESITDKSNYVTAGTNTIHLQTTQVIPVTETTRVDIIDDTTSFFQVQDGIELQADPTKVSILQHPFLGSVHPTNFSSLINNMVGLNDANNSGSLSYPSTTDGSRSTPSSVGQSMILCILGKSKLCALSLLLQAMGKSLANESRFTNTAPRSPPEKIIETPMDNQLQQFCNLLSQFGVEASLLTKYCHVIDQLGTYSLPSVPSVSKLMSIMTSSTTKTDTIDSVELDGKPRSLLQFLNMKTSTRKEVSASCKRAEKFKESSAKFLWSCKPNRHIDNIDECQALGCCWTGPEESYMDSLLKKINVKSPLIKYFLDQRMGQNFLQDNEKDHYCIRPITNNLINILMVLSAMQDKVQHHTQYSTLVDDNGSPLNVGSFPSPNTLRNTHSCSFHDFPRQECGNTMSTKNECLDLNCCWEPQPNRPSCFLPVD